MREDDPAGLSSEELIRRAREGLPKHDSSESPSARLTREAADRLAEDTDFDRPAAPPTDRHVSEETDDAGRIAGFTVDELLRLAGDRPQPDAAEPSPRPDSISTSDPSGESAEADDDRSGLFEPENADDYVPLGAPEGDLQETGRKQRPLLILIAVFLVFVALGNVFFDDTVATDDLEVGDCLLQPDDIEFASVTKVDCSEPHDLEIFAAITVGGVAYPGDEQILATARDRCSPLFEEYVRAPFTDSQWAVQVFAPGPDLWDDGNRTVHCSLFLPDDTGDGLVQVTGSAQGSAQ